MTFLPINEQPAPPAPEAVVTAASISFVHFSSLAARDAPELHIKAPRTHIRRQDIVKCLEKATGRRFEAKEINLVGQCFSIDDSSLLVSWDEFKASLLKMEEIKHQSGTTRPFTNSRTRFLAARRKGLLGSSGAADAGSSGGPLVPLTSSQEIGWGHASELSSSVSTPNQDQEKRNGTRHRAALQGSDITAGGEGSSLASYYGASLGRTF